MIDDGKLKTYDLTLSVHGPLEDDAYSLSPFLVKNIRRGNTIIEVTEEPPKYYMGRKGLPKFFDMRDEYIDPETRTDTSQLKMEERNHKNLQLAGPLKALLEGH